MGGLLEDALPPSPFLAYVSLYFTNNKQTGLTTLSLVVRKYHYRLIASVILGAAGQEILNAITAGSWSRKWELLIEPAIPEWSMAIPTGGLAARSSICPNSYLSEVD